MKIIKDESDKRLLIDEIVLKYKDSKTDILIETEGGIYEIENKNGKFINGNFDEKFDTLEDILDLLFDLLNLSDEIILNYYV